MHIHISVTAFTTLLFVLPGIARAHTRALAFVSTNCAVFAQGNRDHNIASWRGSRDVWRGGGGALPLMWFGVLFGRLVYE